MKVLEHRRRRARWHGQVRGSGHELHVILGGEAHHVPVQDDPLVGHLLLLGPDHRRRRHGSIPGLASAVDGLWFGIGTVARRGLTERFLAFSHRNKGLLACGLEPCTVCTFLFMLTWILLCETMIIYNTSSHDKISDGSTRCSIDDHRKETTVALFSSHKNQPIFKIPHHIKSYGTCMNIDENKK